MTEFKFKRKRIDSIPESKIIEELENAAKYFKYIEFGWREFDKFASIRANTVKKHFGSWKKGLEALEIHLQKQGLHLAPRPFAPQRIFSDKDLYTEMERIWRKVGQRPSRTEWELSQPKISYNTYKQRFGSWTKACLEFIKYNMGEIVSDNEFVISAKRDSSKFKTKRIEYLKENTRNVPLTLRFEILKRDNYRCVVCGKSPVTDIGTKLHIDHIIPFSKGGKSTIDNLQTLYEDCNLGKGDKT
jgi:hypothetical protein